MSNLQSPISNKATLGLPPKASTNSPRNQRLLHASRPFCHLSTKQAEKSTQIRASALACWQPVPLGRRWSFQDRYYYHHHYEHGSLAPSLDNSVILAASRAPLCPTVDLSEMENEAPTPAPLTQLTPFSSMASFSHAFATLLTGHKPDTQGFAPGPINLATWRATLWLVAAPTLFRRPDSFFLPCCVLCDSTLFIRWAGDSSVPVTQ